MKNVFKNLSIKTKLRLSYASILIFIIALSIISITEITLVGKDLRNVSDNELKSKDAILNIRIDLNTASSIIREMIIETHSQTEVDKVLILKEEYDKAVVRINENFTILKNNNVLDSQYIAEYNTLLNDWINKAQKVIGAVEQNDSLKATNLMKEEEIPALLLIEKEAKKMSTDINEFSNQSLTNTIKASNRVTKVVFYTTLIAIIIVIYTSLKITSHIVKPVLEVSEAANKLSNGVLDTTVTYEGNDELGVMAEGVRNTIKILNKYITYIDSILATMSKGNFNIKIEESFIGDFENIENSLIKFSTEMSSILQKIDLVSEQVASGSEQVASGSQELAQGATEQAASVEDLSNVIKIMTDDINLNAKSAHEASSLVTRSGELLLESNEKMKNMIMAMSEISDKSNEIGKIIKTIDDIAFQTNILALNAAVEAARAGNAGKGFAVVADEVRNLAQKSAEAAKNTNILIAGTVEAVENSSKIADETAHSLLDIVEDSTKMTQMMVDIANASEKQSKAAENIKETILEISSVVQNNSVTAEESSAASEELNGQSQILKDLVGEFVLKENIKN